MIPALILGAAQLGFGAYQYFKGQSEAKNLRRPTYQIPDEVKQNLSDAQLRALEGLPEEQKKAYVDQVNQASGAVLNRARDLNAGLSGLAGIHQNKLNAYQKLLADDAAARQNNQNILMQQRSNMAQYKDKAFEKNQMEPYTQGYNKAQALQGAGLQNMMGALQSGVSAYDNSVANKNYIDYLKTVNQAPVPYGQNYVTPPAYNANPPQYDPNFLGNIQPQNQNPFLPNSPSNPYNSYMPYNQNPSNPYNNPY